MDYVLLSALFLGRIWLTVRVNVHWSSKFDIDCKNYGWHQYNLLARKHGFDWLLSRKISQKVLKAHLSTLPIHYQSECILWIRAVPFIDALVFRIKHLWYAKDTKKNLVGWSQAARRKSGEYMRLRITYESGFRIASMTVIYFISSFLVD